MRELGVCGPTETARTVEVLDLHSKVSACSPRLCRTEKAEEEAQLGLAAGPELRSG